MLASRTRISYSHPYSSSCIQRVPILSCAVVSVCLYLLYGASPVSCLSPCPLCCVCPSPCVYPAVCPFPAVYALPTVSLRPAVSLLFCVKKISIPLVNDLERRIALLENIAKLKFFKTVDSTIWACLWRSDLSKLETIVTALTNADPSDPIYASLQYCLCTSNWWETVIKPSK